MASLPHRAAALGLAALLSLGLVAPSAAVAAPSGGLAAAVQTVPAAPKLAGRTYTSLTVDWPASAGVHHYEMRYGTRADLMDATTVEKYTSRTLTGLSNATTYYIQYRAVTGKRGSYTYTAWSGTLQAGTLAYFPGRFTTLETTGGQDSITVTWNRTSHTTHYSLMIADNAAMTRNVRTFRDITDTSYTIRNVSHGSRSGMPNFIRLYAHNKDFRTRPSVRLTAYAAAPEVSGREQVSVATWNILCAVCTSTPGTGTPRWTQRVGTIEQAVRSQKPDVLLLQEAGNYAVPGMKTRAMDDFAKRLKDAGYALDRSPESRVAGYYSNRVAYSTRKFSLVRHGTFALPNAPGSNVRGAAWVLLKSKKTGRKFYAVSFHTDPHIPLTGKNSKTGTVKRIDARMKSLNRQKLPVIIGGDMNSSFYQLPSNIPHETLMDLGWTDAASSAQTTNYKYPTFNGYRDQRQTWGRIDYTLTKGLQGTVSYENVLDIDSSGRLRSVPGSDHNMVLARVRLK